MRVVCPNCGKRSRAADQLTGEKAKCRKCGGPMPEPTQESDSGSSGEESGTPDPTTPSPPVCHPGSARWNAWSLAAAREHWMGRVMVPIEVWGGQTSCQVCKQGEMRERKVYRMRVVVVMMGYILLIPSIPGIILNVVVLLGGPILGLAGTISGLTNIPEPMVEIAVSAATLGTSGGAGILGGRAIFGAIVWFVSGLIGSLLVMKRKVLQCDSCQATVAPTQVMRRDPDR